MPKVNYEMQLPYKPVTGWLCEKKGSGKCAMGYLLSMFWTPTEIRLAAKQVGTEESSDVIQQLMEKDGLSLILPMNFKVDADEIEELNDSATGYGSSRTPTNKKLLIDAFYMLPAFLKKNKSFFKKINSVKYELAVNNINSIIKEWSVATVKKKYANIEVQPVQEEKVNASINVG